MKKKKEAIFLFEDHVRPKTRRDFLGQGMLSLGTGYAFAPSLLSMVSQSAYGQDCAMNVEGGVEAPGFLCFDLAGGASIAGSNVMVGKQGGQEDYLASYVTLGLPSGMSPSNNPEQISRELGLHFHSDSSFLRGIRANTSAETRAKIDGAVFATSSSDDTGNNPHNPVYWINLAGAGGELVQILGSRANESGGRSRVPANSLNPAARPVQIARSSDALSLVSLGKLAEILSPDKAKQVLKAVERLSEAQLRRFSEKDLPQQIKELVQCGYINSTDMVDKFTPARLDANQDDEVRRVFGALNGGDEERVAAMAKLVVEGNAGAGTVELGGFDYHNGTRATGERRDFQAGVLMGQALELAALKGRDLMIYVFSDGSVTSNGSIDNSTDGRGKTVWTGDSGQRGASFILYYRAAGKPKMRDESIRQIGSFRDSGAVNNAANRLSNNVENLSKAVVANYLAVQGREGELEKIVGDNPFGSELDQYLVFDKQES